MSRTLRPNLSEQCRESGEWESDGSGGSQESMCRIQHVWAYRQHALPSPWRRMHTQASMLSLTFCVAHTCTQISSGSVINKGSIHSVGEMVGLLLES